MEGFMAENDVAVAGAPEGISDRLSDSDKNTIRQFGRILSVGKGFLGLSSYSEERSFLRSLNNPNGDGPSQEEFLAFFAEQTTSAFWNIAKPKVQAQELSEIIARFEQKKQCEAYLKALETELSPHNNAQLKAHIGKLGDVSDKVKMAAARGFVLGDLGKQYEATRKQSGIGRFGNFWHTTLGRNVAAPISRLLQPIASRMKAFQASSGAWGKVLGLSVAGGIAFWAAAALLFPVSALGVVGAVIFAGGGVAAALQMPGAFKNLTRVQAQAEVARIQRDESFAKKNQKYRVGMEFTNENTAEKSLITIEGIQEHHFAGKAHLNVATGEVMLPENMHLRYAGFAKLEFDRKTAQLRITLQNSDGIPPEQKATMIQEIVTACTGQEIKKSVVLGTPCNDFKGMKDALNANEETIVNNRLNELKAELLEKLDTILTESLLSGAPADDKETGGLAQYLDNARRAVGVSSQTPQSVRDGFDTSATTALESALSELTGIKGLTFAGANPVSKVATQIMGNVTKGLSPEQRKLALVKVALGGGVPEKLAAYGNTLATAAAIAATDSGVKEAQFKRVASIRNSMGESPNESDFKKARMNILKALDIKFTKDTPENDVSKFAKLAQGILKSTGSVSAEALKVVAAQKQAALTA
jgi:hypothetical protein